MSNTKTKKKFEYRNEDDKAYGLAGMMISAGALNALELIHSVSLDAEGPMVCFTDEYHHLLCPTLSPKSVWERLRRNLYVTAAMTVGNVMARTTVRDGKEPSADKFQPIIKALEEEGAETLSLDADETRALFDSLYQRIYRVFHNPRLQPKVHELSHRVALLRTLSQGDIAYELERL